MSEQGHSRIAEARRRAAGAKQRLGVAAVATFVAAFGLAWASHPGSSSSSAALSTTTADDESPLESEGSFESDDDFGGFDSFGSIAPSGGSAPQVQTHVS
jgi:hypothetical protein